MQTKELIKERGKLRDKAAALKQKISEKEKELDLQQKQLTDYQQSTKDTGSLLGLITGPNGKKFENTINQMVRTRNKAITTKKEIIKELSNIVKALMEHLNFTNEAISILDFELKVRTSKAAKEVMDRI